MEPRRFPVGLADELASILSSSALSSSGTRRPFLKNWRFDQCRFVDDHRSVLEIALSRDIDEECRLHLMADDFVGGGYARLAPGEQGTTSYSALAINLSTLVQETVEPRECGSAQPVPLRP